jgi:hypothetical protein
VVSSIVRITRICPLPKMLPEHALGTSVNRGRSLTGSRYKHFIKNSAIYLEMGLF